MRKPCDPHQYFITYFIPNSQTTTAHLVCYLFSAASVQAIEIKGLFEVEVTALSQSREDRNAALREAMGIVLNRLMVGDNINQDATVKIALDNAASYVDLLLFFQVH
jgi:hypothetical protein